MEPRKVIVAVTGASGSIYAQKLLEILTTKVDEIALIFSHNGSRVWEYEKAFVDVESSIIRIANVDSMFDAVASGSSRYDCMFVIPCSMGTLGRIAHGTSDNLICRAADVMLKERSPLILVTRESPLSLIHIENMRVATEAGAIICPANPSFYHLPKSIDDVVLSVVYRALDLAKIQVDQPRWMSK